jgi:hypothetical protein
VGNLFTRDPYYRFQSDSSDPVTPCREGNVYRNTSTSHDWICNSGGTWEDQTGLTVNGTTLTKTVWETKASRGVRLYGNIFEGAWYPSDWALPSFITLNLTSQSQSAADLEPWATISDIRVWANTFRNGNTILTSGFPGHTGFPCTRSNTAPCFSYGHNNIRLWDNLGYNLSDERDLVTGVLGGAGFAKYPLGSFDSEYRNNTFLLSNTSAGSGVTYAAGFTFGGDANTLQEVQGQNIVRDNIAPAGETGVAGTNNLGGAWSGECSLALMLHAGAGYDARSNVWTVDKPGWFIASKAAIKSPLKCSFEPYDPPSDYQFRWTSGAIVHSNWTEVVDRGTYKVKTAYQGTGSDGRDPGANIDLVNWATAGAATGEANPFLDMQIRSILATSTAATLYLTAPSSQACDVELSRNNLFDPLTGSVEYLQTGKDVRANVSGLTPGIYYYVRARCDSYQVESTFLTSPFR